MIKDKSAEDTISENEYTLRMRSASTRPEDDSPGDSESDAGSEFEMGVEYLPDEDNDPDIIVNEPTTKIYEKKITEIPESAKVISSDQPAPWLDQSTPSSTH